MFSPMLTIRIVLSRLVATLRRRPARCEVIDLGWIGRDPIEADRSILTQVWAETLDLA